MCRLRINPYRLDLLGYQMDIEIDELKENFATKSDDELLDLHAAGTLTELAYDVLDTELAGRGLTIPARPEAPATPRDRPQSLRAHWEGKASLASAYWLIGVVGGIVFGVLFNLLASSSAIFLVAIAWFPYIIFAMVSIWRCAWNANWRGWGYIARTIVVLNGIYFFASFSLGLMK